MKILIDADSCPKQVRDIVFRAVLRHQLTCVQVANRHIPHPPHVQMVTVDNTEGAADEYLCETADKGDVVITRDIPLASRLLEKGIYVINDRGDQFSPGTINERLSLRNVMQEFRFHGILEASQKTFGKQELKAFADCLDRLLNRLLKNR